MSSVENGLFSRFLFYYLDKKTEWIYVLDEGDGVPLDEFFEKLGKEYLAFFHTLQAGIQLLDGEELFMAASRAVVHDAAVEVVVYLHDQRFHGPFVPRLFDPAVLHFCIVVDSPLHGSLVK